VPMRAKHKLMLRDLACSLAVMAACVSLGVAQTEAPSNGPEPGEKRDENLERMRTLAETVEVRVKVGDETKVAEASEKPLLRFSDPSRAHSDGAVWAWSLGGRPVVMAELRTADYREGTWGHDLVLTSEGLASATAVGHGAWSPRESDFAMKPFPGARARDDAEAARLRQMKQLVRRLSGSEEWMGERTELRVLPNPIHRYSDAETALVVGAIFAFVAGTNPEAVLFVEARKQPSDEATWNFGFARMTAASISVLLDGDEVYAVPHTFGAANATYYAFTRPVPVVSKGE